MSKPNEVKTTLRTKLLERTEKTISNERYKTTSFTLLRSDYDAFQQACKTSKRTPSVILREMVIIFIEESRQ